MVLFYLLSVSSLGPNLNIGELELLRVCHGLGEGQHLPALLPLSNHEYDVDVSAGVSP